MTLDGMFKNTHYSRWSVSFTINTFKLAYVMAWKEGEFFLGRISNLAPQHRLWNLKWKSSWFATKLNTLHPIQCPYLICGVGHAHNRGTFFCVRIRRAKVYNRIRTRVSFINWCARVLGHSLHACMHYNTWALWIGHTHLSGRWQVLYLKRSPKRHMIQ